MDKPRAMLVFLLAAMLVQPPAPQARPAAVDCAAVRVVLAPNLGPWIEPSRAAPVLRPGIAMPATPGAAVTLEIAVAGIYGVAIDTGAWIDISRDGQALRSTAHEHGPACTTIRKIVDFQLEPGRYTIMLSRTEAASVLMLAFRR